MFKRTLVAAAFAMTIASAALPVSAQPQSGLVNVYITDVSILNNFLNGAQIAALNNLAIPINVQVPIGVAANVCNLNVAALAQQQGAAAPCEAMSGSQALAGFVNRQVLQQQH